MAHTPAPSDYVGHYGPAWVVGVIVDHLAAFLDAGGTTRLSPSAARTWAIDETGAAVPVVCAELIEIATEDGPIVGRCGIPVEGADGYACPGHALERAGWAAATDAERIAWEADADRR